MDFIQANLQTVIIVGAIVAFFGYRFAKFQAVKRKLPALVAQGAQIVDVRTKAEFAGSHNPAARNIPLDELATKVSRLDKSKPVIVCCASGTRSGMAEGILRRAGFPTVLNAGPWQNTLAAR